MLSPKLISFLCTFTKAECQSFDLFLCSPYFNEQSDLQRLFSLLCPPLLELAEEELQQAQQMKKEVVWKKLFGRQPYNDAKLRRYCSELLHLAYRFRYVSSCLSDDKSELVYLLDKTKQPGMEKHFRGVDRKFNSLKQSEQQPSRDYFEQLYAYHMTHHRQQEAKGEKLDNFTQIECADYYLDCHYYLQKLKHYCDALGYQNFMARKPDIRIPEGFLEQLGASDLLQEQPWLRTYYLTARMLAAEDGEPWFYELKELLFTEVEQLPKEDANALCIHLSNFCIDKKINLGVTDFFHELFDVYRRAIEAGLFLKDGLLSHQDYKNIISVGLHIKEFTWVEYFIQHYTKMLSAEHRDNAFTYNLAKVYFHQAQYEKVIEQLREVEYQSPVYALGSKLLLLLTYFEMGEFLALDSLLDSFRIYLRRNQQISREVKQQYLNVIRFTRKLSRLNPGDEKNLQKIEQQVQNCKTLAARQWLGEKIADLK
jgi:hypothetical protein